MARSPTLADVLTSAMECRLANLHTALPAVVEAYDVTTQTVDVTPLVKRREQDPKGSESIQEYPFIQAVPVVFPRSGNFFISLPIQVGDTVLLVFCESDIEGWQTTGELSTPDDLRRHDLSDAVAIPGLFPETSSIQNADPANEGMVLGSDTGARVFIGDGVIELGEKGAAEKVSVDSKVQDELTALRNKLNDLTNLFNSHIHVTTATVGTGSPGVIAPTTSTASPPDPVGTTASTLVTIKE